MPFIRSISGVRATQGDALTPNIISSYSAAFAKYLPDGIIAIARDGRPSGKWMENIAVGTLTAMGRQVHILGIAPTPTAQIYAEMTNDVAGCIVLTASHNPSEWNGMKFLGSDGVFLDDDENHTFWSYLDKPLEFPIITASVVQYSIPNIINRHISEVVKLFSNEALQHMQKKQYRIVVDAVNAAGSVAIPSLLEALNCEVIPLYCDGTGIFPHTPEPLPIHLQDIAEAVKKHNADFGIAVDPDADRLALIDEKGNPINEEMTITLAAASVFSARMTKGYDPICVVNYSTTSAVDTIVRKYYGKTFRSPVGEINVVRAMQRLNAAIGGEGSGGVIFPSCHYGRDSLVGSALIIHLLTEFGGTLSELLATMPQYKMKKIKTSIKGDEAEIFRRLEQTFPNAVISREDGRYFKFENSWIHARLSNTEPIIRLIAESSVAEETDRLLAIASASIEF